MFTIPNVARTPATNRLFRYYVAATDFTRHQRYNNRAIYAAWVGARYKYPLIKAATDKSHELHSRPASGGIELYLDRQISLRINVHGH